MKNNEIKLIKLHMTLMLLPVDVVMDLAIVVIDCVDRGFSVCVCSCLHQGPFVWSCVHPEFSIVFVV